MFPEVQYWGQFCLTLFINNPDKGLECTLSKSADNTKLGETVSLVEVRKALQRDQWDKSSHVTYTKHHTWLITTPCSGINLGRVAGKLEMFKKRGHGTKGRSLVMGLGKEEACGGDVIFFSRGENWSFRRMWEEKQSAERAQRGIKNGTYVLRKMFQT